MNNSGRIAIIGAGVAGMALAILAAKQGYRVSLYERDEGVSTIGAGVTLWPNAVFVLQQMGLAQQVKAVGGTPGFMRQFDRHGALQGEFDIERVNELSGFPSVTLLRRDLMGILAAALVPLGVEMRFGCAVTPQDIDDLKQEFDLVVGADGRMNSAVRQSLYNDAPYPRYHGFINIIGISQLQPGALDDAIMDFRGQGERFGIVPIKAGLCFWAAAWTTAVDKERPLPGWYEELHRRFQHWPGKVQEVLEGYEERSLNRIFVHDLDPLPYWHKGNVLLLGDAAHAPLPTSGQGACQALEDAWHLVRLLKTGGELEDVLAGFYRQRIAKTTAAQASGRQVAKMIFAGSSTADTKPPSSAPTISAEQLSQFWMQGLAGH
ncbi:FAD-dependent monooxygenase [Gallaecimonas kandeliae]|uniref:FAD-dependent monooxygenase n=1 Tax=Gallaecimonas kandeliae TaxID=3029055 RepID=UPI002649D5EB|nr:FAD-dependent monooxygenase [Gallaecimonas kandeliae]WKE64247.1 FAD-dependent monooxygenase [Gallaecimonas kandeliae]